MDWIQIYHMALFILSRSLYLGKKDIDLGGEFAFTPDDYDHRLWTLATAKKGVEYLGCSIDYFVSYSSPRYVNDCVFSHSASCMIHSQSNVLPCQHRKKAQLFISTKWPTIAQTVALSTVSRPASETGSVHRPPHTCLVCSRLLRTRFPTAR